MVRRRRCRRLAILTPCLFSASYSNVSEQVLKVLAVRSSVRYVNGREFTMASQSHKIVLISSYDKQAFFKVRLSWFFTILTGRFHHPPHQATEGGETPSIGCAELNCLILFQSILLSKLRAPTKYVPLSIQTIDDLPLRAMNLLKACKKVSVERDMVSTKWIVLQTAQVNR